MNDWMNISWELDIVIVGLYCRFSRHFFVPTLLPPNMSASKEEDQEHQFVYDLPRANINRIVKKALPEGVNVVNEAKTAFSKAAVVFIMYLTATYVN